jgi:hypothetical protein
VPGKSVITWRAAGRIAVGQITARIPAGMRGCRSEYCRLRGAERDDLRAQLR